MPFSGQWITTGAAVLGAVLGVVNFAKSWRQDRPQLRVRPEQSKSHDGISIVVSNIGKQDVTVTEVGFIFPDGRPHQVTFPVLGHPDGYTRPPVTLKANSGHIEFPVDHRQSMLTALYPCYVNISTGAVFYNIRPKAYQRLTKWMRRIISRPSGQKGAIKLPLE